MIAGATLALTVLAAGHAIADEKERAAAEASFARAEMLAKERRFAEALDAYRDVVKRDPSAPVALPAGARIADLEAHEEGGFAPLARLEEVRKDVTKGRDRAAIEALERDLEAFPPGRVRAEARVFVAEAWWKRLNDPARALAPFEAVVADRTGDRLTRALALSQLTALRRSRGELREALAAADLDPALSPSLRRDLARLVRREALRLAAIGSLVVIAILGALAIVRLALRARDVRDVPSMIVRPIGVALALYLGGAGAIIVRIHGDADPRPFVWFGLAVLALDVLARAVRVVAGRRAIARALWASACVVGVLGAAFLAVFYASVDYLEGIGL